MPLPEKFPSNPIERSQQRWVDLFFGVLCAIGRRDRRLAQGLMLAFKEAGLAKYQGDELSFVPGLLDLNPTDAILEKTRPFRYGASIPSLRGRIRRGRTRPPYLSLLMQYYRVLYEERLKASRKQRLLGAKTPSERAVEKVAKQFKYPVTAFRKHLEQAQRLYPDLTRLWKRTGAKWIESR